jgi:hypothetical protein
MNVSQLISILSECDPDAQVFTLQQPNWPFEYSIAGVTVREEFSNLDEGELPAGCATSDVFLVEGSQLRYGSRDAWSAARRS